MPLNSIEMGPLRRTLCISARVECVQIGRQHKAAQVSIALTSGYFFGIGWRKTVGEIEQMTEMITKTEALPDNANLPKGVPLIRGVYCFLVGCGLLVFMGMLAGLERVSNISLAETSFTMIINLSVLYGLQKRKNWVVLLVLYFSAWTLLSNFIRVVGVTPTTGDMMIQKVVSFTIALFSIYQIYVFRRKETKQYFDQKGLTLF